MEATRQKEQLKKYRNENVWRLHERRRYTELRDKDVDTHTEPNNDTSEHVTIKCTLKDAKMLTSVFPYEL